MGSSASKQAGKAAAAAGRRQYPSTSSILNSASSTSPSPSTTTGNSQTPPPPSQYQPSSVRPPPSSAPPSASPTGQIDLDGRDPQFGARLSRLGPAIPAAKAKPNESAFPTSTQPPLGQHGMNIFPDYQRTNNPAMRAVRGRDVVNKRWEEERENIGRKDGGGRTLISAKQLSEALRLRERGVGDEDVERRMGLKGGLLSKLGPVGMISVAEGGGGMTDSALVLDR